MRMIKIIYWKANDLNVVKYMNGKSQKVWFIESESENWEWKVKLKRESEKLNIGFSELKNVDQNKLTNEYVNSLIFDWQNVDHEDMFKKLLCLTWWKWKWNWNICFNDVKK